MVGHKKKGGRGGELFLVVNWGKVWGVSIGCNEKKIDIRARCNG